MTETTLPQRARLRDRWPTAVGLLAGAGAIAMIALQDREVQFFGTGLAVSAGIYLVAYALGESWTTWLASVALSLVVVVVRRLPVAEPAIVMTALLLPLWLWAVLRRRLRDTTTLGVQTVGMVVFGALALLCVAVSPRLGIAVAGIGWLLHGAWDVYHFRKDTVVDRPWAEFCGVVDLVVGSALLVAAAV